MGTGSGGKARTPSEFPANRSPQPGSCKVPCCPQPRARQLPASAFSGSKVSLYALNLPPDFKDLLWLPLHRQSLGIFFL